MNALIKTPAYKNIRLLQVYTICANAIFLLPVLIPYYRDVLGLGFREFMIGEAVFSAVMIAMEVPTGWLSDVWGRKKTLIASVIMGLAGWLILWHADGFLMAVVAQGVLGINISLASGTNSALLYDTLLENKQEDEFHRLESQRHGMMLYAVGGASIVGGFMYQWHPMAPLAAMIALKFIALLLTLFMVDPSRHKEEVHKHPIADMMETVRYAMHGHVEVAGIIILSALVFATTKNLLWAQQPYYIMLNLPESWFGIFTCAGFIIGATASTFGYKINGRMSNVTALYVLMISAILACAIAGLWPGHHGIVLVLSGSLIYGIGAPRVQAAINNRVSSVRRATILSAASLSVHVISIPLMVLIGWAGDAYGIEMALIVLAVIMAIGGLMARFLLGRRASKA